MYSATPDGATRTVSQAQGQTRSCVTLRHKRSTKAGAADHLSRKDGRPDDAFPTVLPPDQVWPWVEYLLSSRWNDATAAGFCLSHVCKITGDRKRDFSEEQLERVRQRLLKEKQTNAVGVLDGTHEDLGTESDASALLGEALPVGIRL